MDNLYNFLVKIYYIFYFHLIHCIFWLYNLPIPRKSVRPPKDRLLFFSATKAAELIRKQEITSLSLIEAYIRRIEEVNPLINAVVIKNFTNALKQASQIDAYINSVDENSVEYKNLEHEKPLLGIPFTIKDSFLIKGLICTMGFVHRKGMVSEEDAEVVKRLNSAGAILLAVTNVPEGIMWGETANTLFGRTNNPYDNRKTAGGSSGGEAALIASAGSLIGIGSDFAGSIRGPASFCGIYGFMPSPDIVPLEGSLPVVKTGYRTKMWRIGPLCRYAEDISLVLKVLAKEKSELILHLSQSVDVKNLKIFYIEGIRAPYLETPHKNVIDALRRAVHYFEEKYSIPAFRIDLPLIHESTSFWAANQDDPSYPTFRSGMTADKNDIDCWQELVLYFLGRSPHTLPAILSGLQERPMDEKTKNEIIQKGFRLKKLLETLLETTGVLIFPCFPYPTHFHNLRLFTPSYFSTYCGLWNALDFCALSCPMGFTGPYPKVNDSFSNLRIFLDQMESYSFRLSHHLQLFIICVFSHHSILRMKIYGIPSDSQSYHVRLDEIPKICPWQYKLWQYNFSLSIAFRDISLRFSRSFYTFLTRRRGI